MSALSGVSVPIAKIALVAIVALSWALGSYWGFTRVMRARENGPTVGAVAERRYKVTLALVLGLLSPLLVLLLWGSEPYPGGPPVGVVFLLATLLGGGVGFLTASRWLRVHGPIARGR